MITLKKPSIRRTIRLLISTAIAALFLAGTCSLSACTPDVTDDEIGFVAFDDEYINLSLPAYQALRTDGGFLYLNSIGVRGVILYRKSEVEYLAFERNCTFQPQEACSTVDVHVSQLYMTDACCGSTFSFSGAPTAGPAWRNLRQYHTSLNGTTLVITDDVL